MRLVPLAKNSKVSLQNIKDFMAQKKYKYHLEKDQILSINGEDVAVIKMHPDSGIVKENTVRILAVLCD